jgi:hypothetical protein
VCFGGGGGEGIIARNKRVSVYASECDWISLTGDACIIERNNLLNCLRFC